MSGLRRLIPVAGLLVATWLARAVAQVPRGSAAERPAPTLPLVQMEPGPGEAARGPAPPQPAPSSQPPGQPVSLQPLAVTQLDDRQRALDLDAPRISLRAAEPMPLRELLLRLVENTGFSVVPDPDVGGTFVGELKNVTLRQALELALPPLGVEYAVEGRLIRVFRRRLETRLFDVSGVAARPPPRVGAPTSLAAAPPRGAAPTTAPPQGEEVPAVDDLTAGVRTLLSDEGRVHLDRRAGVLQVTDAPDRLDRVSRYLEAVQIRLGRQVALRARVIEVELTDPAAAGVDWAEVARALDARMAPHTSPGAPVLQGTPLRDVPALLGALAAQGRVRVLASPSIVALHNETVLLRVGTEDVYFVATSQLDQTSGRIIQTMHTPHAVMEGVVLRVTAEIGAEGVIELGLSPTVTERVGEARAPGSGPVPVVRVREATTRLRVYDGEPVLIAGLLLDRVERQQATVPVLGQVPLVGAAFRREARRLVRTELVVLLTPAIVTPGRTLPMTGTAPGGAAR